ncbi:MAG TPA: hypothetical protein VHB21_18175 [Minicystis sp.]|nr:hypothetical protein [Minicystis sp.]
MKTALFFAAFAIVGCTMVNADDTIDVRGPPEDQFQPVALYLVHRCGSLDCHGEPGRNLRLYGQYGLRLDRGALTNGGPTTPDEIEADYRSVVALEPEIMTEVVHDHGKDPQQLTFYRKPRGLEHHKGGTLIKAGDPQDVCIRSWLASSTDVASCQAALDTP